MVKIIVMLELPKDTSLSGLSLDLKELLGWGHVQQVMELTPQTIEFLTETFRREEPIVDGGIIHVGVTPPKCKVCGKVLPEKYDDAFNHMADHLIEGDLPPPPEGWGKK